MLLDHVLTDDARGRRVLRPMKAGGKRDDEVRESIHPGGVRLVVAVRAVAERRELAALGIRAVTIAPGIFETPMLTALPEVPTPHRFVAPSLELS